MIDFEKIEGFDWDAGNDRKSEDKHQVSQAEVERVFFKAPLVLVPDVKHSQTEPRFHAVGKTTMGRLLHLTVTLRFEERKIRPICARDRRRKERRVYEESAQANS